jgi:hypothetical protein
MPANTVGKISSGKSVANITTFIGEKGNLFYDTVTGNLRISDGVTLGGNPINITASSLPVASTVTLGAVRVDGQTININNQVISAQVSQLTNGSAVASLASTGALTVPGNIIPPVSGLYTLGDSTHKWADVWIGPNTLNIQDTVLGTNAALTVTNGVLLINGVNQLQVGQLKFFQNTIESTTGSIDIQIGLLTSTANIVLNRNLVLSTAKTLSFTGVSGSQSTPYLGTATTSQIGGVQPDGSTIVINAGTISIGSVPNSKLANSSLTVTAGSGLSGGGSVALGGSITLTNSGVTSIVAGSNISISGSSGAVTINASVSGAVVYQGAWNASTNTIPTINATGQVNGVTPTAGYEYSISVTGTQNIGAGSTTYTVGGFIIYNGTVWNYIPPANNVTSFNTRTGAITLTSGDVTSALSAGSITNTLLANSSVTVGTTAIALGASATTLSGLSSVSATTFNGALTGNVTGNVSGSAGTVTSISGNTLTSGQVTTALGFTPISLSSHSVTTNTASGGGALSYSTSTGVFTFTPAVVSLTGLIPAETNVWYVAKIGSDSNDGHRLYTSFLTIAKALSVAQAGDTVYVQTGTYSEVFPLTVPKGVSVRGAGLREVTINPTPATNTQNGFLLSGETTVSDLTIGGQFYNSGANTGYAFAFQANASVTTRSPYIERVTVLQRGSVTPASDPYGYAQGDAGRGALIDGSQVLRTSIEPAMLFNECTFFVPNSIGWYLTNGARSEILTTFSYFAQYHVYAVIGSTGYGGTGKTYVAVSGASGTYTTPGNTLRLYSSGGTLLGSGTIESYNSTTGSYTLTGLVTGLTTNTTRASNYIVSAGNAQNSTTQHKFGTASLNVDGTSYIATQSNADFGWGTGDFTVEGWIFPTAAIVGGSVIFDFRTTTPDTAILVTMTVAGGDVPAISGITLTVGGVVRITNNNNTPALNTWTHIAISRTSNVTRMFINGVLQTTTYTDNNNYPTRPMTIGASYLGTLGFNGFIDEVRNSKGVSRYTTTFTTAVAAFTADANTVLLLHFDGANGTTSFTDDGITIQDVRFYSSVGTQLGTATGITRYDLGEFAARTRQIACAFIYGANGVYASGANVVVQLMAHNFAYIGTGYDLTNNSATTDSTKQVTTANGAYVFYNSVDQDGNYLVGSYFAVNFKTGAITFSQANVTFNQITLISGANRTYLDAFSLQTGQLQLTGNNIITTAGNLNLIPNSGSAVAVTGDVTISGNITTGYTTPTTSTTAAAITVNLNADSMYVYTPSTTANVTVTLANFVAGRTMRMFITPAAAAQTFTFTGVSVGQTTLNKINPRILGGAGAPTMMLIEIYSTTTAVGGVFLNYTNAQ